MKIVIADDEALARERLRYLLSTEADAEIVAECANGAAAVEAVHTHAPDLLLLDVQMPEMDGFESLRQIKPDRLPEIIFFTGFDQHAVRAFEAHALDYLLKPTTRARLAESLGRVREKMLMRQTKLLPSWPQALLDLVTERQRMNEPREQRIAVREGKRTTFIEVRTIDWVEAAGNYVILHVGVSTHVLRETMAKVEEQLARTAFLRVSRSAILNLRRVRELQASKPGEHFAVLTDGIRIATTISAREIEMRLRTL